MTDIKTEDIKKVPATTLPRLRDEWQRAVGAAQAAEASKQVAQGMFTAYQQRLATVLEMLGLDANLQWYVDFNTGVISDKDPSAGQNGVNGATPQLGS
jgi:hypothetical protein